MKNDLKWAIFALLTACNLPLLYSCFLDYFILTQQIPLSQLTSGVSFLRFVADWIGTLSVPLFFMPYGLTVLILGIVQAASSKRISGGKSQVPYLLACIAAFLVTLGVKLAALASFSSYLLYRPN